MKENKYLTDILSDKDDCERVVIPDDYGEEAEFEKVAVITVEKNGKRGLYALLRPVSPVGSGNKEKVYVFRAETTEKGTEFIFETDEKIKAEVFCKYAETSGKKL